jgi:hypothetical protein
MEIGTIEKMTLMSVSKRARLKVDKVDRVDKEGHRDQRLTARLAMTKKKSWDL